MNIEKITRNERMLRSIIWIWKKEFDDLLSYFEEVTKEYYRNIKTEREQYDDEENEYYQMLKQN